MVSYTRGMTKRLVLALTVALAVAACKGPDVRTDLQIVDVRSGWFEAGRIDDTRLKIVPGISFRLKNVSQQPVYAIELTGAFRILGESPIVDSPYVRAIPSNRPLAAGATSEPIVLRSQFGVTGTETRLQMLRNSRFVDRNITILGKARRRQWAPMGVFTIARAPINR